ncbi:MAG: hypothetical protein HZB16_20560 [Armatimonadetes bacterium]|nr:hypothetical protein [Armatimonadota bacterium]
MRIMFSRACPLTLGALLIASWPLTAGGNGNPGVGNGPKPDKGNPSAAWGQRYEGVVKAISADSITLGGVNAKATRPLPRGGDRGASERDTTLGLSTATRYGNLTLGARTDLAVGRAVALALVKQDNLIAARGVVVYTGAPADGASLCEAATTPLLAAVSGASAGERAARIDLGGGNPSEGGGKPEGTRVKGLVGTIDSLDGDQLVLNVGGNKLAVSIADAGLGKVEPRGHDQIVVGRRVLALCRATDGGAKDSDAAGKTVAALLQLPAG